jgi:putative hydrolase of the HAD superfamily
MKERVKVIFFDAGGTLIRPARPVGEIYAQAARNYGRNWDGAALNQTFRQVFRKLSGEHAGSVPRDGDHRAWWRQVVRETIERVTPLDESFPFEVYFEELYHLFHRADLWRTFPEVEEVLGRLKKEQYRLAILSNWDNRLHATLEGLELSDYFDARLVSAELGAEKPQAEIYAQAVKRMGIRPEEALMVGDEPINDYWAPRAQGWQAILVERPSQDLTAVLQWLELCCQNH